MLFFHHLFFSRLIFSCVLWLLLSLVLSRSISRLHSLLFLRVLFEISASSLVAILPMLCICYLHLTILSLTQCLGVYLGHPVPGGYKYGDLVLQTEGVSRIGTIKCGLESRGTQTRAGLCWRGPAARVNYTPVLSSERTLQNNKTATV
jgi:hypothetical protein